MVDWYIGIGIFLRIYVVFLLLEKVLDLLNSNGIF